MNIKKLFLSIIAILVLVFAVAFTTYTLTPESSVTITEIKKTSNEYKRPVREGNCWRQFIGTGDTDSILVCH
jgi:uncharacterized protein YpmS